MPEKYQEEIEEILEGIARETPSEVHRSDPVNDPNGAPLLVDIEATPRISPRPTNYLRQFLVSPGKVALVGLLLFFVGALSWPPLMWVGLATLVGAYLLFFVRPRPAKDQKIWRGRVVEDAPSWSDRLKRWLKN